MTDAYKILFVANYAVEFFDGKQWLGDLWMGTQNPMLGELTPNDMIAFGNVDKLYRFVLDAKDNNDLAEGARTEPKSSA